MILFDLLLHKYIRRGERLAIYQNGRRVGVDHVKGIIGVGKYAAVMLDPVGAIRRDGIKWDAVRDEWFYNYQD